MNFLKSTCLCIAINLVGCAYMPATYQVVDTLPYKRGYMTGFYKTGVTEEVVKAKHYYKITVKLDKGSSKSRAESMLLYHSAKLAQQHGSKGFTIKKINNTVWCGYSSTGRESLYTVRSGPVSSAFITLIQPTTPAKMLNRKTYSAEDILTKHEHIVLQGESKPEAKINEKTNKNICVARLNNA